MLFEFSIPLYKRPETIYIMSHTGLVDYVFCYGLNRLSEFDRDLRRRGKLDGSSSDSLLLAEHQVPANKEADILIKEPHPVDRVYKAQLEFRYPEKKRDISDDFPDMNSMFCFPYGILIEHRAKLKPPSSYHFFTITDKKGQKRYGISFIFYDKIGDNIKAELKNEIKKWKERNISNEHIEYASHLKERIERLESDSAALEWNDELFQLLKEQYAPYKNLFLDDSMLYSPRCYGLISHWPFYGLFRDWLYCSWKSVYNGEATLECFIHNIFYVMEIPPEGKHELIAQLPHVSLKYSRPSNNSFPILRNYPLYPIFSCLSPEKVVRVFEFVANEGKVLFISKNLSLLGLAADAVTSFLYPMYWQHIFIPVLPAKLIGYIQSPVPYIMGIHSSYTYIEQVPDDVLQVDLDNGKLMLQAENESFDIIARSYILPNQVRRKLLSRLHKNCKLSHKHSTCRISSDSSRLWSGADTKKEHERELKLKVATSDAICTREKILAQMKNYEGKSKSNCQKSEPAEILRSQPLRPKSYEPSIEDDTSLEMASSILYPPDENSLKLPTLFDEIMTLYEKNLFRLNAEAAQNISNEVALKRDGSYEFSTKSHQKSQSADSLAKNALSRLGSFFSQFSQASNEEFSSIETTPSSSWNNLNNRNILQLNSKKTYLYQLGTKNGHQKVENPIIRVPQMFYQEELYRYIVSFGAGGIEDIFLLRTDDLRQLDGHNLYNIFAGIPLNDSAISAFLEGELVFPQEISVCICCTCNEIIKCPLVPLGSTEIGNGEIKYRPLIELPISHVMFCESCHQSSHDFCTYSPDICPQSFHESKVQEAFLRVWTSILGNYRQYFSSSSNSVRSSQQRSIKGSEAKSLDTIKEFRTSDFLNQFNDRSSRDFMNTFVKTQCFTQFISERIEFPNDDKISLLFDECIKAKQNKSMAKISKDSTPLLSDQTNDIRYKVALAPVTPLAKTLSYKGSFPSSIDVKEVEK